MDPVTIATTALTIAQAAGQAAQASGFDIAKMLGIRPKGQNDNEYVRAVSIDMQAEYDKAQAAVNQTNDPDAQKAILDAYNAEVAAWGNPSNPNRNVAIGQGRFASQIDSILASAKTYSAVPIPAAQASTTTPTATIAPANNTVASNYNQSGADVFSGVNAKPAETNPWLDNAPIIFIVIGILIIVLFLKRKGK